MTDHDRDAMRRLTDEPPAAQRDIAIADAARAFALLCDSQRLLIDAEAELTRARAARVRGESPPPTREQIAGALPTDAGRRREPVPVASLTLARAVAIDQWGPDPGSWPQWICAVPSCAQPNSGSAMECGRCEAPRPVHPERPRQGCTSTYIDSPSAPTLHCEREADHPGFHEARWPGSPAQTPEDAEPVRWQ